MLFILSKYFFQRIKSIRWGSIIHNPLIILSKLITTVQKVFSHLLLPWEDGTTIHSIVNGFMHLYCQQCIPFILYGHPTIYYIFHIITHGYAYMAMYRIVFSLKINSLLTFTNGLLLILLIRYKWHDNYGDELPECLTGKRKDFSNHWHHLCHKQYIFTQNK